MDNDIQSLKRMLEEATASCTEPTSGHPGEAVDAETASLRETWLAFGKLVEAANAALPGPTVPQVQTVPRDETPTTPTPRPLMGDGRKRRMLASLAVTAAAAVVVVGLSLWMGRATKPVDDGTSIVKTLPAKTLPSQATPLHKAEPVPTMKPTKPAAAPTWDDPLETEVASISRQIIAVKQTWRHRTDEVDIAQDELDEIRYSLQHDPL